METDDNGKDELKPDSPLLDWGILNSMSIVRLLNFVRDEFDVVVPVTQITARNFKSLNTVTDMVLSVTRA